MERKTPSELVPSPYGKLFTMYNSFNAMQTSLLNDLLYTDKSIVLSAPTGSGKTVAFELAIVRMLLEAERLQSTSNHSSISPKAIYIAPIKALCSEKYDNWRPRFDSVGINCTQLTGDTQSSNLMAIRQAQVVISTPEKWDSLTRRWRDSEELLLAVKLFIVDEVHLLNEDTRGPILEAIVARMKSSGVKRFLVASATIPNVEDLTSWIGSCNVKVAQYVFNEMQRPVPLEKHVLCVNTKLKGFQFDMKLNYQLPEIIRKYSEQKATLIFCSSRKSAEMAAFHLNKIKSIFQLTNQQKTYLHQLTQQLIDTKLRKLVENGIAYHHAGLQYADRNLIESSFREGFLMVLLSTSTLAMGINLPAHLVVIKSTETYISGSYAEYAENMLLQMIGRAGRPQYDTKGVAVVLTQSSKVEKYKKLMNGKAPIESHLHKHLTEHLNSEIALNSINNLEVAMEWIRSTYLYVRSVRNPKHYGFPDNMSKELVEHKLEELSYKQINALESAGLVTINKECGLNVQTTPIGKLMAKYYLCFETMKLFRDLKGNETLQNVFDLIVKCKELSEFKLRVNEKKILNALNKTPIRFPIKGRIKNCDEKISCILQAILGNLDLIAPSLVQESLKMFRISERISKCVLEYVRLCVQKNLYYNTENGWYKTLLNAYIAAKCFHVKLWENSEYASKQLHGIGTVYSKLLNRAGKTTLKSIAQTEARTIELILNKPAPFGDEVLQNLLTFPEYEIKLVRKSADFATVYGKQINENYVHKADTVAVLIVGDSMNNLLLLAENFDEITMEYGYFERTMRIRDPKDVEYIYGHVIHTSLIGVDAHDRLEINAPKAVQLEEAAKKPKKQQRLNVTINETLNETSYPLNINGENSENAENNKINESESITTNNLSRFHFVKRKISHDEQRIRSPSETTINKDNSSPKIATIKPLNETTFMNDTNEANTLNVSRIIQRKLTDFFLQRKKTALKTVTSQAIDLTRESEDELNTHNSKNLTIVDSEHSGSNQYINKAQGIMSYKKPEFLQDVGKSLSREIKDLQQMKMKRTSNDIELPSTSKKQKFQHNSSFDATYKPCPTTLASFLGDMGQKHTVTSLLERESIQKENTQKPHCSSAKVIEVFDDENIKQSPKSSSSSTTAPKQIPVDMTGKKRKYQHNSSFEAAYKQFPTTLASFLGDMGETHTVRSLLERENFQRQQCLSVENAELSSNSTSSSITVSKQTRVDISSNKKQKFQHSSSENIQKDQSSENAEINSKFSSSSTNASKQTLANILAQKRIERSIFDDCCTKNQNGHIPNNATPLDLSMKSNEKANITTSSFAKTNTNKDEISSTNKSTCIEPTDEEFELWFKVSMKFQRLPTQAMSLKNFRYIYNKVITMEQRTKKQTQMSSQNSKSNRIEITSPSNKNKFRNSKQPTVKRSNSSIETSHSSSSASSFRLQLFPDYENTANLNIRPLTEKTVNEEVPQSQCTQNMGIDLSCFDEELTVALKDLENGLTTD